ncbi:lysophospholipid acyltransferase family protein [Mycoplasma phocimorsus]|uniref:Lysophospholipid acyltransferase family protein n=1 Tax=Mycoplasma phocimorsus TaxID=3045839 RepID=A0AAJ1PRI3_9MOLU|nr:lysophospholipid acyltransferase family protein [Mycoplasma phocimorsus]MDJ1646007.1 lysophospholipid acyltransferase family protein [Mycoplasma phocimorsus]MDJ1646287.1 lysophospholipid acyltransferase family protein [Mycoplasma phocimorsus]MDJ1646891.1 lysophospholipid acyltransferase family protein [Mycoplasma phocimorsus]MDJ1647858.1 lysophospholipid acyltransferase family protein [Mycoplasma phocimorsus]MDJ1648441.1 lysophospholipid acyltransferase family protein [Mycoplasma phocimorsu
MTVRARLFWNALCLFFIFKKINKLAKKKRKSEFDFTLQSRYNSLLKHVGKILKIYNIKVEVKGYENLHKTPALLTPNHTSNLDVLVLMYALRKRSFEPGVENSILTFIAKIELVKKRTIRNAMELIDTFLIDRSKRREALEQVDKFANYVKTNKTYGVIFPEGTRTKTGEMNEFKGGAFKAAQSEYLPIIPVSIINGFKADDINRKQKRIIKVIFHPAIKPISFISQERSALAKRVQNIVEQGIKENEK